MDDNICLEYFVFGCEYQEQMDREEGLIMLEVYGCFDFGKYVLGYDIGLELGIVCK